MVVSFDSSVFTFRCRVAISLISIVSGTPVGKAVLALLTAVVKIPNPWGSLYN